MHVNLKFLNIFFILFSSVSIAQITQTVKGKVSDNVLGINLPGAIVQLKTPTQTLIAISDINGVFKLFNVPVGRHSIVISYTSYQSIAINNIIVSSGKETILNIEMEENSISMNEIEINASADTDIVNTMQSASMKAFSIEETERYAGSRSDPARMASNFAGVQGSNDSRNDIVVRGNSPSGLLWRMEEIDIPNPNHFAVAGSSGGPQSIINNKYLANSEFFTGAFPANYGNALGGVFDLKMRNGNSEKHERTFQFGFLGTEIAIEGPLRKKNGASYLLTYRYSTLALFSSINFNIGTSAVPGYQDLGIRLNYPTKKNGVFSFSSIAGLSDIKIILSKSTTRPKELYGDLNRDQYFATNMGVGILNHTYAFNSRIVIKTTLAYGVQTINAHHNLILRDKSFKPNDTIPPILGFTFYEGKTTLSSYVKGKINLKNSFKSGFFINRIDVNFIDSVKTNSLFDTIAGVIQKKSFKIRIDNKNNFYLVQPYFIFVHKFNDKLSFNGGLFSQFLSLNDKFSIEPRLSIKYQINPVQSINLAYGLHSQMQQTYLYYTLPDSILVNNKVVFNDNKELSNQNLDFSKSQHLVLGHDFFVTKFLKIKTEIYFQYLWNVPVYNVPSSISLLNRGATFSRFFPIYSMKNTGTGYNYGLEFTIEKLFSNHYFFMYNASLFDSKYIASNGILNNTDFNGNYAMNLLAGLEFNVGKNKKNNVSFGTKVTYGGGKRYSPVNIAASNAIMDVVAKDDSVNTLQFSPYNRIDFRISYKLNFNTFSMEYALDLVNVLSTKNILALSYAKDPANLNADPLIKNYQLGFLPLFYLKVDF